MSESELSAEECAAELRRRKWRGRDDWYSLGDGATIWTSEYPQLEIHIDDARALCLGWRAQDELAELRERLAAEIRISDRKTELNREVMKARDEALDELAAMTRKYKTADGAASALRAELEMFKEMHADVSASSRLLSENNQLLARIASLTEENHRLKNTIEVLEDSDQVRAIAAGLKDIQEGRTKPIEQIRRELAAPPVEQPNLGQLIARGFITCESRSGDYFVKIKYRTLEEAQELHAAIVTGRAERAPTAKLGEPFTRPAFQIDTGAAVELARLVPCQCCRESGECWSGCGCRVGLSPTEGENMTKKGEH